MTTATKDAIPDLFAGLDDSVEEAVSSQEDTLQAEDAAVESAGTAEEPATEQVAEQTAETVVDQSVGQPADEEGTHTGADIAADTAVDTKGGPGFTAYWLNYKATLESAEHQVHELVQASKALFGWDACTGERIPLSSLLRGTRKDIRTMLFAKAERDFAPVGGKLQIDRHEIYEEVESVWGEDDDDEFDPDAIWLALERKFGGDAGVEAGLKQTASLLVVELGLSRSKPTHKANRLEIESRIWAEKRFSGGYEMGYSARERVVKTLMALATFCEWAGDVATARRLRNRCGDFGYGCPLVSRQRFDNGGIGFVTFLEKITWEIYGDLGQQFQAFIGLYGREAIESRR